MNSERWRSCKLTDIVEVIGGGTPRTSIPEYWKGDIPWISVVDFQGEKKYIWDTEKHISRLGLENSSTKILKRGQVIISARGTVGELAILGKDMAFNQSCYGLDANNLTSNEFVYYLLKHNINQIKQKTNGAVFDTITRETLEHIIVNLPSLSEQKHIVEILSTLDDKIELNRQTNATLEAIAQAIFKEWFVDFNYPGATGELVDSELGNIPQGWRVERIGKVLETALGGTPSTKNKEYWENGTIPWINSGKVNEFRITQPTTYITLEALKKSNTKLLPKRSVVIAITGATLGQVSMLEIDSCANQSVIGLLENEYIPAEYIYLWTIFNINSIISNQSGGAQQHINSNDVENTYLLIPAISVLKMFKFLLSPVFDKESQLCFESSELIQLRDLLLPELMSGKIDL